MSSRSSQTEQLATHRWQVQFDPTIQALYHHPTMGIVVMDLDGRYQMVNPMAARFFGESAEKLVGKLYEEVFPDSAHQDALQEARAQEWVCFSQRRPQLTPRERIECWDIAISLRRDPQGHPCGFLGIIQEVSSFRHALQEAARQQKLFRTLLEEVPAGVVLAQGKDARVTMMNATARALYGDALQVGSPINAGVRYERIIDGYGQAVPRDQHPLLVTIQSGISCKGSTLCETTASGKRVTLLMDTAPLGNWDGEPAAIAVFQDISGHAEHERELEVQNHRLRELDQVKDSFLANVSHELKTPLTAILGWVSAARELDDTVLTGQALAVIERSARRQAWMIDDLLTLSNCLAGRLLLLPEVLNVREEAIARAQCAPNSPLITLELDVEAELTCTADPIRLRQLLENLLTNALKFTPHGGVITVKASAHGEQILLEVADTGIGIDQQQVRSVFRPFWQADSSAARKYNGTGIGLTVVKELVALHGGTIEVRSAGLGRGTCFSIRLPKDGVNTTDA